MAGRMSKRRKKDKGVWLGGGGRAGSSIGIRRAGISGDNQEEQPFKKNLKKISPPIATNLGYC